MNAGNVYGTYIHGIFDEQKISDTIVRAVCAGKGILYDPAGSVDLTDYKNRQYDLLADAVRENLDMEFLYRVIGE